MKRYKREFKENVQVSSLDTITSGEGTSSKEKYGIGNFDSLKVAKKLVMEKQDKLVKMVADSLNKMQKDSSRQLIQEWLLSTNIYLKINHSNKTINLDFTLENLYEL
jgi:hypothetical protein